MNFDPAQIREALMTYLIVLGSLTLHEWGHAYTADRLGDDTPRRQGRVTLNPLAHIDLIGTVVLPLMGALGMFGNFAIVGWAKPVMIDPRNLPKTSARAWVTIAGPAMNFLLALLAVIAAALATRFAPSLVDLCILVMRLNVMLMVFNLLPVPPLDGSKFLMYWFGMSEATYVKFAQFGWLILLVMLNLPFARGLIGALMVFAMQPFAFVYSLIA